MPLKDRDCPTRRENQGGPRKGSFALGAGARQMRNCPHLKAPVYPVHTDVNPNPAGENPNLRRFSRCLIQHQTVALSVPLNGIPCLPSRNPLSARTFNRITPRVASILTPSTVEPMTVITTVRTFVLSSTTAFPRHGAEPILSSS